MPDYSKGKIYIIRAPGTDSIYIGSTTMALNARLRVHQQEQLRGGRCRSAALVATPGHTIELLEAYPCATGEDLRKREGHHIRENAGRALNKNIAGRTGKEYMTEYADRYRERALAWYYANKERRQAYNQANREKRLAWQRNYYATVIKPQRLARLAAAEGNSTTSGGGTPPGEVPEEAAALKPTSVAAAAPSGV